MNLINISLRLNAEVVFEMLRLSSVRCMSSKSSDYLYKKVASNHVYKNLYPWTSNGQLADELFKNIIYNEDNVIAINKPYGVGVHPPENNDERTRKPSNVSGVGECELYIANTLPYIQSKLGLKNELKIVKSTDRFSSGITILSSERSQAEKVSKCLRRAKAKTLPLYTYQAIVTNIPVINKSTVEKVGIRLEDVPEMKQKVAVIEKSFSKAALKRNEAKVAAVQMQIQSFNNIYNAAFIQISTTTNVWHFVRAYLAHNLAPVLGDVMYGARVKTVMGKAIALSPHNSACYKPIVLSDKICNQLRIPKENILQIPCHLHLHRVTLTGYFGEKDLVLIAFPNNRFLWTAEQLKILPETENKTVLQQSN